MLTDDDRNHLLSIADAVASLHAVDGGLRRDHCLAAAERLRAIAAPRVATVGELLATAPVGSIVEYLDADGDIWHQVEFNATMTAHRRRIDSWDGWKLRDMPMRELRQRARLVPADQADLDPSTRGPIGEG